MERILKGALLVWLGLLAGCVATHDVHVDVRTEYRAGVQFHRVLTKVLDTGASERVVDSQEFEVMTPAGFVRGAGRVADLVAPEGTYRARVVLLQEGGEEVARGESIVDVRASSVAITVDVQRRCADRECPGSNDNSSWTECIDLPTGGGRCVPEGCDPSVPGSCPDNRMSCEEDSECIPAVECAVGVCLDAECLSDGDDSFCSEDDYCDVGRGCVPRPCRMDIDECSPPTTESEEMACGGCDGIVQHRERQCTERCAFGEWSDWSACAPRLARAALVVSGEFFSCALDEEGNLSCWGNGLEGQLGNGSTGIMRSPVTVAPEITWAHVGLGYRHACAIDVEGVGYCWGDGSFGQLGLGDESDRRQPQQVRGEHRWQMIDGGDQHSCGIDRTGGLWCWGNGNDGQLGLGHDSDREAPVRLGTDTDWVSVTLGERHSCALKRSGQLYCWGQNTRHVLSQNGLADYREVHAPQPSTGEHRWDVVRTFWHHACGIRVDGTLWCWGDNIYAQLGNGEEGGASAEPVRVGEASDWRALSVGYAHTCAINAADELWCWGKNDEGRLTDGSRTRRLSPVRSNGGGPWREVAPSRLHTCAIDPAGAVHCVGDNGYGQIGRGTHSDQLDFALACI